MSLLRKAISVNSTAFICLVLGVFQAAVGGISTRPTGAVDTSQQLRHEVRFSNGATSGTVTSRGGSSSGGDSLDAGATGERLTGGAGTSGDSTSSGSRGNVSRTSGDSTLMGSKIESSYFTDGAFLVETTGARFEYVPGELKVYQGPGSDKRLLSTITFEQNTPFKKVADNNDHVLFWSDKFNIDIYGNSTCIITPKTALGMSCKGNFKPTYSGQLNNELAIFDNKGGVRFFPPQAGISYNISNIALDKINWTAQYVLGNNQPIMIQVDKIVIIWHQAIVEDPNMLRIALSSGRFTHVMLGGWHTDDIPDYSKNPTAIKNLQICRDAGVKIIWRRWAWPGYHLSGFKQDDIFSSDYYVELINDIKKEATALKVDYTALDLEPYGNAITAPLKNRNLTPEEFANIEAAVSAAIQISGQVDFVLPAAFPYTVWPLTRQFYKPLQKIGKMRVAEHTYYNNPYHLDCENCKDYDIFGAYCRTATSSPDNTPGMKRFGAAEILGRTDLWLKKGLFIYAGVGADPMNIAIDFSKLSK